MSENKRAYFDYEILEKYEAGIELTGTEVKAIRTGRINLAGSYVIIRGDQAWLINADIPAYQPKNAPPNYDSRRTRRLLLNRKEIQHLIGKNQEKSLTLLPLKVYTKNQRLKMEIGVGRPKKKADKRETIKKREAEREIRKNAGM